MPVMETYYRITFLNSDGTERSTADLSREHFLARDIQPGIPLANPQHDGFSGNLLVTSLDGMRVQQFSSFGNKRKASLFKNTG